MPIKRTINFVCVDFDFVDWIVNRSFDGANIIRLDKGGCNGNLAGPGQDR